MQIIYFSFEVIFLFEKMLSYILVHQSLTHFSLLAPNLGI